MRIIAGKHRGRKLEEFDGNDVRPTADRAKEALFNILQGRTEGSDFLDLYSGTGSIGLEALSRGAKSAVLVDSSAESVRLARKNNDKLGENARIIKSDALSFVKNCRDKFDIVFLDPPYKDDADEVVAEIAERNLLKEGGIVVYERSTGGGDIPLMEKFDERKYGIAIFEFYRIKI